MFAIPEHVTSSPVRSGPPPRCWSVPIRVPSSLEVDAPGGAFFVPPDGRPHPGADEEDEYAATGPDTALLDGDPAAGCDRYRRPLHSDATPFHSVTRGRHPGGRQSSTRPRHRTRPDRTCVTTEVAVGRTRHPVSTPRRRGPVSSPGGSGDGRRRPRARRVHARPPRSARPFRRGTAPRAPRRP